LIGCDYSFIKNYSRFTEVELMIRIGTDEHKAAEVFHQFIKFIQRNVRENVNHPDNLKEAIINHIRTYCIENIYSM